MASPTDRSDDRALARRIATMMRLGTATATVLLTVGAAFIYLHPATATVLLTAGCGVLIAVPILRLAMMAGHFARRSDRRYAAIACVVLLLVIAGGAVGLLR